MSGWNFRPLIEGPLECKVDSVPYSSQSVYFPFTLPIGSSSSSYRVPVSTYSCLSLIVLWFLTIVLLIFHVPSSTVLYLDLSICLLVLIFTRTFSNTYRTLNKIPVTFPLISSYFLILSFCKTSSARSLSKFWNSQLV